MLVLRGALAIWAGHTNYIHVVGQCWRMIRHGGSRGRSGMSQVWGQGLMAGHANYIQVPAEEQSGVGAA